MKLTRIRDKKPEYGQKILLQEEKGDTIRQVTFVSLNGIDRIRYLSGSYTNICNDYCWCELPEWPGDEE